MFLFVSFTFAYNFCVEKSFGSCNNTCKSYQNSFKNIFNEIPTNPQLIKKYGNGIHNIYIADNIKYIKNDHNLIFCDPSNYLIYPKYITEIKINNDIIADDDHIKANISILFNFKSSLELKIHSPNKSILSSIILKTNYQNTILNPLFLTDNIPKNIFQVSPDSQKIQIYEMTNNIKTLFSNTYNLIEIDKTYYCITDKPNGCQKYNNQTLNYIKSASSITQYPSVVIVDSTLPQLLRNTYQKNKYNNYIYNHNYVHIICESGSDITYYPAIYAILHNDSIEMKNGLFTGEGNFTIVTDGNLYLHSTTNINKYHFTIKSSYPMDYHSSRICTFKPNSQLTIEPKINVPDFCVLHGNKNLAGLFNSDKFISQDTIIKDDVTENTLKEYPYTYFMYNFRSGTHNIPVTFTQRSHFYADKKTSFIFNEVHSFSYDTIDNFVSISDYNTITINPANYFILDTFWKNNDSKFVINVNRNITMRGSTYERLHSDKITTNKEKCKIVGNGTINFVSQKFMDDVIFFCEIQSTVKLQKINSIPNYYICVGQTNLKECKSKISNISSIKDTEWVWYRTIGTYYYRHNTMYITDTQIIERLYADSFILDDMILTSNAHLLILGYNFNDNCVIKHVKAQEKSAKITVLNYENYKYSSGMKNFYLYDNYVPKNINLEIYLYYESMKLYTYYVEDYQPNSIKLRGKCIFYIREPIQQIKNIFNYPSEIHFVTNPINDFTQICYANQVNECTKLDNFVFTSNYSEFLKYESSLPLYCYICLCKDISFNISSRLYKNKYFFCKPKKFSISCYLPNNARILFDYPYIRIFSDNEVYSFYLQSDTVDFIFDIKKVTTLDYSRNYSIPKSFTLTSNEKVVKIIPSPRIIKMDHINISGKFKIKSPVPQYLNKLIGSNVSKQLSSWTYLYLSKEGKSLYESYPASSINNYIDDDDISEKVVLAVGKNDNISIPSNWKKSHSLYILQENNNTWGSKISSMDYQLDSLTINDKTSIIYGDIIFNPQKSFYINAEVDAQYSSGQIMYYAYINCSNISNTLKYIHSMYRDFRYVRVQNFECLCSKNELVTNTEESDFQNDYTIAVTDLSSPSYSPSQSPSYSPSPSPSQFIHKIKLLDSKRQNKLSKIAPIEIVIAIIVTIIILLIFLFIEKKKRELIFSDNGILETLTASL